MTNEKEEGVTMENHFDNTPENNGQQTEQPVYTDPNADVNQQHTGGAVSYTHLDVEKRQSVS